MDRSVAKWSTGRRYEEALRRVLEDGETVAGMARFYGVSRSHLQVKKKAALPEFLAKQARLQEEALVLPPQVQWAVERKRLMPFRDFSDKYFSNWQCPDCHKHHEMPEFHQEISDAIQGPELRVLINVPPYHSKSTLVTVQDTVYDLCMNPNSRTLLISKTLPFAKTFLHSIKELLTNRMLYEGAAGNLIDDFGPFQSDAQPWSTTQIYVSGRRTPEKDATVEVAGVQGQIYGRRADKIKFDDIATLENQRNPDRVQTMLEWIDKEALSRIGKSGKAVWVGTRVYAGDIYSTLDDRPGYRVIRYPVIISEPDEETLWSDHFPYSQVEVHRSEMKAEDFQLVYMNVDVPGLGASFTQELVDDAKDTARSVGHYLPEWRLIAGLDPAGGNKKSGFTAFTLLGVNPLTGQRWLVDQYVEKAMKAPALKQKIFEWSERYPIFEWRVESNGVQSQIVQYDIELVQKLAHRGIRVSPHITTGANKWDPQFGVESIAPLFAANLYSIPWGNAPTAKTFQPLIEEMVAFPMGHLQDRIMSLWFAELGVRDLIRRAHLPLFDARAKIPNRIKRKRRVVDFTTREVRGVLLRDQTAGQLMMHREVVGRPQEQFSGGL